MIYVKLGQARYAGEVENTSAGLAPFERVAESVRQAIRVGDWKPGHKLSSNREMAKEQGVSLATLQKALALLQDEGWLVSRASIGVYVASQPPEEGSAPTLEEVRREVADLREELGTLRARLDALEPRRS
ncbi:MAG TPA: GntR family transcriptional regulator [Amycolatopsis sp.]|nr:GntR family transcriptional regulator [Amycolatopsis sp.]